MTSLIHLFPLPLLLQMMMMMAIAENEENARLKNALSTSGASKTSRKLATERFEANYAKKLPINSISYARIGSNI